MFDKSLHNSLKELGIRDLNHVVVFDFDGVVVDSIRECFFTAWWTYHGIQEPNEDLFRHANAEAELSFSQHRYLVGPAWEYYYLARSIDEHLQRPGGNLATTFEAFKQEFRIEALTFADAFFRLRAITREKYPKQWVAMNPLYSGVADVLRVSLREHETFIASTKDKDSIHQILQENGVAVPRSRIFGNELGGDKRAHLSRVIRAARATPDSVSFIDDNPRHLRRVRPLGVRLYLATWGYIGPEGREAAERIDANLLTIRQLEKMLT